MPQRLLQVLSLVLVLLLFFISLELMGDSFKLMGKGVAENLVSTTRNPFVGLFIGILATSMVQSSSTVTAMVVGIVAGGGLTVAGAVPIMMGANIGTSVTNTIVSLGHITRKDEFRRAMAGATVHDFFNLLAVAVLFPVELLTGAISRSAHALEEAVIGLGGADLLSPVKVITDPVAEWVIGLASENGIVVLLVGVVGLFIALRYLVKLLRALLLGRSEKLLHKYVFGHPLAALFFGVVITVMVQSSSITTSVMVPMVGAGIVTVAQIFPFVLGANIGTTVTSILAALVLAGGTGAAGEAALTVAFAHFFFNVFGIALLWPLPFLRRVPIWLAEKLGELSVKNRGYAFGYIALVFFVLPVLVIVGTRGLDTTFYEEVLPEESLEVPEELRLPGEASTEDSLEAL
ncbi:MAG: Na/Pi symporter [Bacteroidota bacterium]